MKKQNQQRCTAGSFNSAGGSTLNGQPLRTPAPKVSPIGFVAPQPSHRIIR